MFNLKKLKKESEFKLKKPQIRQVVWKANVNLEKTCICWRFHNWDWEHLDFY